MKKSGCLILAAGSVLGVVILLAAVYFVMNRETSSLTAETRAALPGQFITLSEGVTHYQLAGPAGGQLVVFVNGFSVGAFGWERTVPALTAAGFRVLTYDLYGRGYSDRPAGPYTLERFVRQLDELLGGLQIDRPVDLASLSMGGYISAGFAVRHPEHVRRVLMLAPQAVSMDSDSRQAAVTLPVVGEYLFAVYMVPVYLADSQGDFKDPQQAGGLHDQYLAAARYAGFSSALLSTLRNMTGDPLLEYRALGRLGLPVLVIWGEEDQTSLYANAPRCWTPSRRPACTPSPSSATPSTTSAPSWSIPC